MLTGSWNGPDPVLAWGRGSVCMFSQNRTEPVWVPEQLVRRCQNKEADLAGDEHVSAHDGCGTQMEDTVGVKKLDCKF